MLASEIATRVRREFGDESAVQIQDADIIRWINDAQREIVSQSETVLLDSATINLVASQNNYTLPADMLVIRSVSLKVSGETSYYLLRFVNYQEFDMTVSGWDGTERGEGRPIIYTIYNGEAFLFPTPDAASTAGIKVLYSRKPTDVTALLDTLELPDGYLNAIFSYCMKKATTLDEDYQAATLHGAEFLETVKQQSFKEQPRVQSTYPVITIMPEDQW